jgi:hypothetical protein
MGRYEFRVVVSDIDLSEEQEKAIEQAVALAGVMAVAEVASVQPMYRVLRPRRIWCGLPPFDFVADLDTFAARRIDEGSSGRNSETDIAAREPDA